MAAFLIMECLAPVVACGIWQCIWRIQDGEWL